MRVKALLLLVSCFITAEAMAAAPSLMEALEQARAKWESHRSEDYAFEISNTCSCPDPADAGPLVIIVRGGKVRRTVYVGNPRNGYSPKQAVRRRTSLRTTIPDLFELIEKKLRTFDNSHFKIKYDDKQGHPIRFEYDDPQHKGEETLIVVKDFKHIE